MIPVTSTLRASLVSLAERAMVVPAAVETVITVVRAVMLYNQLEVITVVAQGMEVPVGLQADHMVVVVVVVLVLSVVAEVAMVEATAVLG